MDYNQLKAFITVAQIGNLTQAAERLHISQPAVSAQIKAIEKNLNVILFNRNASGMSLTLAGEAFLPEAEALMQHHHRLDHFAQTLCEHYVAQAQIGLIHPADPRKITQFTHNLLKQHPDLQLHIQYGMSGEIEQRVLNKQIHGGFFLGPVKHRSLRSVFLENIYYSLICPTDIAPEAQEMPSENLSRYPWIEMSSNSASRKHLQQLWRQHKIAPMRQIVCDYPQTIIDLVCEGVGLAMVPAHKAESARRAGKPIHILQQYRQTLPLNFIYLNEYESDPTLNKLKDCVCNVWQVHEMAV